MSKLWFKNNLLILDSTGKPQLCDQCPCGSGLGSITWSTPGPMPPPQYVWQVPPGATKLRIKVWGGGGGASWPNLGFQGGGGGGGGGYTEATVAVTGGSAIYIDVAVGGGGGFGGTQAAGDQSGSAGGQFGGVNIQCRVYPAAGGWQVAANNGDNGHWVGGSPFGTGTGHGGAAIPVSGTAVLVTSSKGGDGGPCNGTLPGNNFACGGGGGGSSGGTGGNGQNGTAGVAGAPGVGGTAPTGGGSGGNGSLPNVPGNAAVAPGGGGGACGYPSGSIASGAGKNGQVTIIWGDATHPP